MTPHQALRKLRNYAVKNYDILPQFVAEPYVHVDGAPRACLILVKDEKTGITLSNEAAKPTTKYGRVNWLTALGNLGRDRTIMLMDLMLLGRATREA